MPVALADFRQPIGDVLLRGRPSSLPLLAEADTAQKKKKKKPPSDLPPEYRKRDRRRVRIEAEEPEEDDRYQGFAVWNQVAIEGEYKGHPTGDFYLGREEMLAIVRNFQAHPSYEADPALRRPVIPGEDLGHGQVIPWDFHHASEEPGAIIGVNGAPAQSWVHDFDVCRGENGLELWSLVEFLEPAKSYVQGGKYRFASIAFWPNAKDAHTGEDIGPYVSSIAFTNDPFIQGMEPLAAERQAGSLVPNLKKLLDLPAEATESTVLEAVSKLGRAATAQAPEAPGVAPTQKRKPPMPHLLTRIASALGVEVADDASEPQLAVAASKVEAEITTLKAAREKAESVVSALAEKLGVKPDQWSIETGIVTLENEGSRAKAALEALFNALQGVETAEAATAKVGELLTASALLQEVMPALSALQGPATAQAEEEEEEEVMAAMRHYLHPSQHETMKPALLQMRGAKIQVPKLDPAKGATQFAEDCKALITALEAKQAAKVEFRKSYPLPEPENQHLLRSMATTPTQPGAGQPVMFQHGGQPPPPPPAMGDRPPSNGVNVSQFPGGNPFEQLMNAVRFEARQRGEGELSHDEAWTRARLIRDQSRAGA